MTTATPKVAISDKFMLALTRLPRAQQKKAIEFVTKFRQDPQSGGINYEKINDARDPFYRSVRIDHAYRGIVRKPDSGNTYLLLWVDKHDDAYDWACRHNCEVHPETGTLQVYESIVAEPVITVVSEEVSQPSNSQTESESSVVEASAVSLQPLFDLADEQFLSLGVPQQLLGRVSAVGTEAELEQLERYLPVEPYEALYLLAAGTPWAEIEVDYVRRADSDKVDTSDIDTALMRSNSLRQFHVIEDELELQEMLNAPLERWRVFLHPTQRKLVQRDWNGPVRVLGGAGTGKTVVAMHRARWLVKNALRKPDEKILVTTFTANLSTDIESNLRKICSSEELARIEVKHIDRWVSEFLRRNRYPHEIAYEDSSNEYKKIWKGALALSPALGLPDSFFKEEWQRVVLPQRVQTKAEYFKAKRIGRGVALNRKQRAEIWQVFEEVRMQLHSRGMRTFEDATLDAADILATKDVRLHYRAVVVDEAQDMGPEALSLIRQLVPEDKNDLFIVGDGHQRIYRRKATMSHCGIKIVGRSRKLRINYRTTEETRRFASAILEDTTVDDLDGGEDTHNDYRSLTHGMQPEVRGYPNFSDEQKGIEDQIHTLVDSGVSPNDICIATRTRKLRDAISDHLVKAGLATLKLNQQRDDRSMPGVRLATMHRVKGLEFHFVFLAGINEGVVPLKIALSNTDDPVELRQNDLNERALLHVASTRAIRGLYLSYSGNPSSYLLKSNR